MTKQISLVTLFVLLNMGIGRMFQESLGTTCFSELSILAITGFFFWNVSAKQIKVWSQKWAVDPTGKNWLIQGGLGLSASVINIIIGQLLVVFLMTTIYQCTSPSFDVLNASMTNNIAVNLLCYFSLLFYFLTSQKPISEDSNQEKLLQDYRVVVSKNSYQYVLQPEEIVYVEASNNCIVLHTEKGKFVKYQSLKSFSDSICKTSFKRVHRSYVVNSRFVDRIQKNHNGDGRLHLKTGEDIKFSRTYHQSVASL